MLVAVAGAAGAVARFRVGLAAPVGRGEFPWATLAINVAGSFLLGAVLAFAPGHWSDDATVAVGAGFLGAFTTYSTFSNETVALVRGGHLALAGAYVLASVVVGLAAAAVGYSAGRALA